MGLMRVKWQTAKRDAETFNNGQKIKFSPDMKLGDSLDKFEIAERTYQSVQDPESEAGIKAGEAYIAAFEDLRPRINAYNAALPNMDINDMARKLLDNKGVTPILSVISNTLRPITDLKKKIARLKKEKEEA